MLFFIAKATDLSRQTVTKHLKAFRDSDEYNEQQAKLETMRLSVLGLVYKMATQGNKIAESLLVIDFQPFLS